MPVAGPVFILALPLSYSSLACAMMGQHPQMYDLLETLLFDVDLMFQWWAEHDGDRHRADGLKRVVAEVIFGCQCVETVNEARQWLWARRTSTSGSILKELGERLYPLMMVEQTPVEGGDDREVRCKLQRRLASFPRAKFLHMVRHPRTFGRLHLENLETIARNSRNLARMSTQYLRVFDGVVIDAQVLWHRVNSNIQRFLTDLAPDQHLRIRGEDLAGDPRFELRRITKWLGLPSNAEAIEAMIHPERSPFACVGPVNATWGGDPGFLRDPVLRIEQRAGESLDGPLSWRPDGLGFGFETRLLAQQFGYS